MRFDGKVAVVTGGSSGIGRAAAITFAEERANVVVVDINVEEGESIVAEIRRRGKQALFIRADVSKPSEVCTMVDEVVKRLGRLDILVNNAGIYRQGDVTSTSLEDWGSVLAVNLTGPFLCTKHAAPAMLENGGGIVVNVASEAGLVGIKGQVAYNVSKGGLIALTRSCALDLAEHGIRVNSVCPGTTYTPLVQEALSRDPNPAETRRLAEQARPLNRWGTPEEIASAILYLASDEAGYATGSIFSIDGGYTAQ